jgi:Linear amide C-N hydrolases, choloylglycine hydrolase family
MVICFDAPYHGFGVYNTEYRTVMNLTNKRYFFELTTQPNVIWADLPKFDLRKGHRSWSWIRMIPNCLEMYPASSSKPKGFPFEWSGR